MAQLTNRNFIIGVTGSIAAYKSAELVRELSRAGASVRVIMTAGAQEFITPLTMQAVSGHPVHTELLDTEAEAGMGHIELARWADAIIIAPASADSLARLCDGRADDLLTSCVLASPAPLFVAPAMNQGMWANEATQANVSTLQDRGIKFLGPDSGSQACGDIGTGRLMEPTDMVLNIATHFSSRLLEGRRVVITAGPTREPICPVRYLSNHSSGKMGYALANACAEAGALTTLISGPVALTADPAVSVIRVTTALEMHEAAIREAASSDVFIGAAAVADFRPASVANEKIKRGNKSSAVIELVANPDIIAEVARIDDRPKVVMGFAAETENTEAYAHKKLIEKAIDCIFVNDVSDKTIGFDSEFNAGMLLSSDATHELKPMNKRVLASHLVNHLVTML
ncbi:MAG: bifunctional 4'-phosphopantothenoylcysteine decarboxylase/phosphopantothenoylcysteine synthetase [Cellvibrionales bacterium TMED21]|nr:bifunctional phosphopantothenoylcysteine decarboxylase/phosphopantothenate--cysteine ligase CoaBC [Halieaceae bacterium]OUT65070.1 MAG: bifunctional 4'-phosphopantothenoylcysteine decarboxylase/phosphopantothenoylcysteine synthetase [Cellvibrionales bacterium TMED21]